VNPARLREADEPSRDAPLAPFSASRSSRCQVPRRQPLVLIADDTADVRDLYSMYLTSRGFRVLTAQDGAVAIQTALDHRPDVIVMDLAMPQFDGITAAQRIKANAETRQTRVILLTGYPHHAIQQGVLERGVDRFLTKPCLPEELERHVNELRRPALPST
jgi:two-component system, cell cycle response regulator DivK